MPQPSDREYVARETSFLVNRLYRELLDIPDPRSYAQPGYAYYVLKCITVAVLAKYQQQLQGKIMTIKQNGLRVIIPCARA